MQLAYTSCEYSHSELSAVLDEIITQVKDTHDKDFISGDLIRNSDVVYIVVSDGAYESRVNEYTEKFGDMVAVESENSAVSYSYTDGYETGGGLLTGAAEPAIGGTEREPDLLLPAVILALVLAAAAALWLLRARIFPALRTVDGGIVERPARVSRREPENTVKDGAVEPDVHV